MTRYRPARRYVLAAVVAFVLAAFSAWCGLRWTPAFVPAFLLLVSGSLLAFLAARPPIVLREKSWSVGKTSYRWTEVERLDTTGWTSPLVLRVTFRDGRSMPLIYPGEPEAAGRLLRQMRRLARDARIEGIPYEQYWGADETPDEAESAAPRYRMLRPQDEAEVERLFQRLKAGQSLDRQASSEERD